MKIQLSPEVLEKLPQPAEDGLVRINAAIRVGEDGMATIASIEDIPVGESKEEDGEEEKPESPEQPMDDMDTTEQMAGLSQI
ncbi:MAG: hypothetical protein ACEQSB_05570 [Undibacterium sp.]